jgi:hypothetical protein
MMSLEVEMMSETNKPKAPKFTLEFKQDAARLVIEKGLHPPAGRR